MKFNKFIYTFVFLIFSFGTVSAQYEDFENNNQNNNHRSSRTQWFLDHFTFGGNVGFGLGFGDNSVSYVEINPIIGYRFNNYFNAGLIFTYEYYKYKYAMMSDISRSIYGGGIYAEAFPLDFLVIHAEAQYLNFENYYNWNGSDAQRMWDMPILVGAGYRRVISDRVNVNFMLLWNINNTNELNYNVYSNPIVRVSIQF
ncbi:MAG: hypothetical protein IKQ46_05860 [Bacteroidales bacterium]|nr:hypothetical protein [Bacteroidales bacterium]